MIILGMQILLKISLAQEKKSHHLTNISQKAPL